jgi:hypothetical protein
VETAAHKINPMNHLIFIDLSPPFHLLHPAQKNL